MKTVHVLLAMASILGARISETRNDAAQEAGSAGEFVNEYLDCDETVGSCHHTPGSGDDWALNLATEMTKMSYFENHTVGSVVDVGPETWPIFNTDDLYIGAADTTQIIMCTEPTDH